jgi:protein Tex
MINTQIIQQVAGELKIKEFQAENVVTLIFDEDCTIPFVARYRKEKTGLLDEVKIREVRDRYTYLHELEITKTKYLKVVEEHCKNKPELKGKFPELKKKFELCQTKNELEDLYLPFKPKRRTRAQIAKEKGLEPLANKIVENKSNLTDLLEIAAPFVTPEDSKVEPELKVATAELALQGASDIIAERIAETPEYRALARQISNSTGVLSSKLIEGADQLKPEQKNDKKAKDRLNKVKKYEIYFDYKESIHSAPSHRVMAVRRGEAEKILRVDLLTDQEAVIAKIQNEVTCKEPHSPATKQWFDGAAQDACKRLLGPSIEAELRIEMKRRAEDDAIKVFSDNLSNLLLLPPMPGKLVLGIDPGLRTGSKLAVIDQTGKLLDHTTIYPDPKKSDSPKSLEAQAILTNLLRKHSVECIAIGNGTGSREIDRLVIEVLRATKIDCKRLVVNEAGASVYSTDPIAREEFPDLDPTIRSAVSIARRLQDPLAELVKIDPRSIGVGQYQHDVNVTKLNRSLTEVVESCVNKVGVNLNTASFKLLSYVSGIGPMLAKSIVDFRDKNGVFSTRTEINKVSGLGAKVFQQAAGFLRVPNSSNPLDNSGVHPESYEIVEQMAADCSLQIDTLIGKRELVEAISLDKYVTTAVGIPTLKDISSELIKPGRDPRQEGSRLLFSDDIAEVTDLKIGMKLKGTVTNVTNFGAFVDIGVHQDGLVHISELSNEFITSPAEVVSVGDVLDIRVLDVDYTRKRISLSSKPEIPKVNQNSNSKPSQQPRQEQRSGARHRQEGNKGHNQKTNRSSCAQQSKTYSADDLMAKFNQFAKGNRK